MMFIYSGASIIRTSINLNDAVHMIVLLEYESDATSLMLITPILTTELSLGDN